MADIQEYKCPCCGGAITFDSSLQKMKCPFCDTEFEMDALKAYDDALKSEKPDDMQWDISETEKIAGDDAGDLCSYICNSCGGEIVTDLTTGATSCPYCGNPVVVMDKFSGLLKPDLVIPFKLDKAAAKEALKNHYKGKKLLPKVFSEQNHIDEIKGVYVPVWLFDTTTEADVRYKATRIRCWSSGKYRYTETSFYLVQRSGKLTFEVVPVDGSEKMPDDLMESIEPFDLSEARDFQTAYLSGYFADKYDVESDTCINRANARVKASTEQALASTVVGYTSVIPEGSNINFKNGKIRYALYPVWLLNTTWNGKQYKFAMNGQTGKMAGDLPTDKGLAGKYFFLTALIGAAAAVAVQALAWLL